MAHLIVLDTETADFIPKSKLTIEDANALGYDSLDDLPLCFQLSYIHDNGTKKQIRDCVGKPPIPISITCSEITNIVNSDIEKLTLKEDGSFLTIKETPEFKELKNIIDTIDNNDIYIVGHNTEFDIDVLRREGLDLSKCKIIDTLQLSKLYDKDVDFNRLHYLLYAKPNVLELVRTITSSDKMKSISKMDSLNAHNSLFDVCVTNILLQEYRGLTLSLPNVNEANVLEKLYELTHAPILLTEVPFGTHKGKIINELDINTLLWILKTDITEINYKYALDSAIELKGGYRNVISKLSEYEINKLLSNPEYLTNLTFKDMLLKELDFKKNGSSVITLGFGKHASKDIQDIDESYLQWLQKNNSNANVLSKIESELLRRKGVVLSSTPSSNLEVKDVELIITSTSLEDFLNN